MNKPTAVELFCGVGGLGLGFKQAGFNLIQAFDNNPHALSAHQANFPECETINTDILEISKIESNPSIIIAGPPCQGFSQRGKQNLLDPRNELIVHTAKVIAESQTNYFVIENVAGLTTQKFIPVLNEVYGILEGKYLITTYLLNAVDFGVPQNRQRVFIIGTRRGSKLAHPVQPQKSLTKYTVRDAIADLPDQEGCEVAAIYKGKNSYSAELQTTGTIKNCQPSVHRVEIITRFNGVEPGSRDSISHRDRLHWERPSPTILAGSPLYRHTACLPIHPEIPRTITIREAARISSFPDSFVFPGGIMHSSNQIGNAVPPKLALAIAKTIRQTIEG